MKKSFTIELPHIIQNKFDRSTKTIPILSIVCKNGFSFWLRVFGFASSRYFKHSQFQANKNGILTIILFSFFVRLRTYFAKLWSLRRQKPAEVNRKETRKILERKNRKTEKTKEKKTDFKY